MPISQITGASIQDGSIVVADLGITTFNTGTGNTLTLQANSATGLVISVTGNTAIANSLSFSSTGARITGDFSNATVSNRVMFQTSTANSATSLYAIPNGTSTTSQFVAVSNSDPTNASVLQLLALSTESQIRAGITGSGSYLPFTMYTGGSERLRIDTSGNVGIGTSTSVYQTQIYGSGQQTAALTDAGNKGGSLLLNTPTVNAGDGGALLVGAGGSGAKPFAAIKGLLTDGGGNTTGSLAFSTRNATGDTALTERMRITSTGNIGIGTTSPSQLLHVAAGTILASNTSGTTATVSIAGNGSTTGTSDFALQQGTSSEAYVFNRANSFLVLGTNNTERMRITSAGIIGIGSNAPAGDFRMTLAGDDTINPGLVALNNQTATQVSATLYASSSFGWTGTRSNHSFIFLTNGTERMRLDTNGNLGIGTGSPQTKLYVSGGTIGNAGTNGIMYLMNGNTSGGVKIGAYTANGLANGYLAFEGYSIEYGRFDSNGNFGIGTTSPATNNGAVSKLLGLAGDNNVVISGINTNSGYNLIFEAGKSGRAGSTRYAQIQLMNTSDNGSINFYTAPSGSDVSERFRIGPSGQLGIGGTNYGSSGQALVSNGSGSAPSWQSVGATAGQIIQVIQAVNNTVYTISGGSGGANLTGMEITITPRNSSSRFLLKASLGQVSQSGGGATAVFNFTRNGTSLNSISGGTYNGVAGFVDNNSNLSPIMPSFSLVDSPGTASAITYRITISGDGTKYVGRRGNDDFFRASQQFQVLEIAG
jgi:hypothetical protein